MINTKKGSCLPTGTDVPVMNYDVFMAQTKKIETAILCVVHRLLTGELAGCRSH